MTRYIFFDLGNVLLSFDHGKARRQIAELARLDEQQVHDLVFDDGLLVQLETGHIDDRQFHQSFCESTNTNVNLVDFLAAYSDIFDVIKPMERLVANLRTANIPLGILSNTSSPHWNHVCDGRFELLPGGFRDFILSFEVASMKPDREIYDAAIARAGCDPSEIFFCDDRADNVNGALRAGIDAVLFESSEQIAAEIGRRLRIR